MSLVLCKLQGLAKNKTKNAPNSYGSRPPGRLSDWPTIQQLKVKWTNEICFHSTLSQVASGFLLGQMATLVTHHCPVLSCGVPCFTAVFPNQVLCCRLNPCSEKHNGPYCWSVWHPVCRVEIGELDHLMGVALLLSISC